MTDAAAYAEAVSWKPERPRFKPFRLLISWATAALALFVATALIPGVSINEYGGAIAVSLFIAIVNAVLPPIVAALRLPLMLVLGFLIVLFLDAAMLVLASDVLSSAITVDSFWWALLTALVAAAVTVVIDVVTGANDDDTYTLKVIRRIAGRSGERDRDRRARDHFPRDRRARIAGDPAGHAGRERAHDGALARR